MRTVVLLLVIAALSGCQPRRLADSASIPVEDALSDVARAELHLPSQTDLTLANKADMEFVKNLSPETIRAVEKALKPAGEKVSIVAARPVGNYLLLWVSFPEVADGGVDLLWSVEKNKAVGTFCGGYRG